MSKIADDQNFNDEEENFAKLFKKELEKENPRKRHYQRRANRFHQ